MIEVVGVALDSPFRVDGGGGIMVTKDLSRQITQRVRSIIGTSPGERVMRPAYGAGALNWVFELDDEMRASSLAAAAQDAVEQWEPAVFVDDVEFSEVDPTDGKIDIVVNYRLRATGERASAVIAITPTTTYGWPT